MPEFYDVKNESGVKIVGMTKYGLEILKNVSRPIATLGKLKVKFVVTKKEIGKTLLEVESEYPNTKVIAYKNDSIWCTQFDPSKAVISKGDLIAIIGVKQFISKIYDKM